MTARMLPKISGEWQSTPIHLWEQVATVLNEELATVNHEFQLPSEAAQCARFGVSRVTIRQALAHVQGTGRIESRPGRGWFVVDQKARQSAQEIVRAVFEPAGKLMSFSDMARSRGSRPDSVVLEKRVHPANLDEAEAFAIMPGADIFLLHRIRRLNGIPIAIDRSLVPLEVIPDALTLDFSTISLHAVFRAVGAKPSFAETEIEALCADPEDAQHLGVTEGFPLLKVRQAFFSSHNRVIERGEIVYRGDRYRYRSRVHA